MQTNITHTCEFTFLRQEIREKTGFREVVDIFFCIHCIEYREKPVAVIKNNKLSTLGDILKIQNEEER